MLPMYYILRVRTRKKRQKPDILKFLNFPLKFLGFANPHTFVQFELLTAALSGKIF